MPLRDPFGAPNTLYAAPELDPPATHRCPACRAHWHVADRSGWYTDDDWIRGARDALRSGWRPTLAWAMEHRLDERDPLAEAWARCPSAFLMRWLLDELGHPAVRHDHGPWSDWPARLRCGPRLDCSARCPACCDAIRRAVPTLTLAEVLAAGRRA